MKEKHKERFTITTIFECNDWFGQQFPTWTLPYHSIPYGFARFLFVPEGNAMF